MTTEHTPSTSKKSLWPYGIIGAFVLFIAFFGYIVFRVYQTESTLVSKDSYQQGLKYEGQMESIQRAQSIGVNMEYFSNSTALKILIPDSYGSDLTGTVQLYRPSDSKLDFEVKLHLNEKNEQLLNLEKIKDGYWIAKINFVLNDESYYAEQSFTR